MTIALVALLVLPALAAAATPIERWQVRVEMPPQLWDDGASLPLAPGAKGIDSFRQGGRRHRVAWNNFSVLAQPKFLLRQLDGFGGMTGALVDAPLAPAVLAKHQLKQRVLWSDSDVLVARLGTPTCGGITEAQLQGVLAGTTTDWHAVFPDWPADSPSAVTLYTPDDQDGDPRWTFGRKVYGATARETTDAGTLAVAGGSVAVNKLSFVARYLAQSGTCVVPIDGVVPDAATTRSLAYRHAYHVYYVDHAKVTRTTEPAAVRQRWYFHLFGATVTTYLHTWQGRVRYVG